MKSANLVFPHQLLQDSPLLKNDFPFFMVEEYLFFKQYVFHKQKIAFHRSTMKYYEAFLRKQGRSVHYVDSYNDNSDIRDLILYLKKNGVTHIHFIDPVDNWLENHLIMACQGSKITYTRHDSPLFLNSKEALSSFFRTDKKKYHQTSFYIEERKKRAILTDKNEKPVGGKWTFDAENRKKYPVKKVAPAVQYPDMDMHYEEAKMYVNTYFGHHLGEVSDQPLYPIGFENTNAWFQQFLEQRFMEFGTYEDAIVAENSILHHSVLTPMMNIGLITPDSVIGNALEYAREHKVPLNSVEGFIRQIIGWREFIRGMYISRGSDQRTTNFWNFQRKIPTSFYNGTTGIPPIDQTIKRVLKTGYCHHIERLMVLGNFMVLCEFDPDEVYRWFMELFIDAYDWVMVPNVYGMSQFSDGGLMATKPYISGSNYLMKMSNYKKGGWQEIWDGLFWRFMDTHRSFFEQNPRLGMLVRMLDKMPDEKKENHLDKGNAYLLKLDTELKIK